MLAGGRGEREAAGARLAREGAAPVLLFSDGGRADSSFITAAEFLVDGGISGAYVTPL